jgi:hypothetical protein
LLELFGRHLPLSSPSTRGRNVPEALLITWRSFLSSPWMSLMTWTAPWGQGEFHRQSRDFGDGRIDVRDFAGQGRQTGDLTVVGTQLRIQFEGLL